MLAVLTCYLLTSACRGSDEPLLGSDTPGGSAAESDCSDGLDQDQDGRVDCDDPDCDNDPVCIEPAVEIVCDDGVDDDGDERTDCDDLDCSTDLSCNRPPRNETVCDNQADDDADGDADCDDHDCTAAPACGGTSTCELATCCYQGTATVAFPQDRLAGSLTTGDASDGPRGAAHYLDDIEFAGVAGEAAQIEVTSGDFDTYLYLLDEDCEIVAADDDAGAGQLSSLTFTLPRTGIYTIVVTSFEASATGDYVLELSPTTPSRETICDDLQDNDDDGDADCDDPDCIAMAGCDPHPGAEIHCNDDADNDGDGDIDCEDSDCLPTSTCGGPATCELAACCYQGTATVAFPNDVYAGSLSTEDQLSTEDPTNPIRDPDHYFDDIEFAGTINDGVHIQLVDADFDPFLYVLNESCEQIISGDDSAEGLLPQIDLTLPYTGIYTLVVTSYNRERTGDYVLRLTPTTPGLELICDDADDNDDDGLTDCDDRDCLNATACVPAQ